MAGLFDNIKNAVESVADEVVDTATEAVADVTGAAQAVVDEIGGGVPDVGLPELTLPGLPGLPGLPELGDRPDLTLPGMSPTTFDVLRVPSPLAPSGIPVPYPNLAGIELPDLPTLPDLPAMPDVPAMPDLPDPGPVTIAAPHVGEGSTVAVVGAPDVLLGDVDSVELPDLQIGGDTGGLFLDVDPIVPGTPTAHGGVVIGGVEIDAALDAPGIEMGTNSEIVATVDPSVTGLVPSVGGVAGGGDTTIDLQPDDAPSFEPPSFEPPSFETPSFDEPSFEDAAQDSAPSDFESTIDAIDDTAEQFDIFD